MDGSNGLNFSCSLIAGAVVELLERYDPPTLEFLALEPWLYLAYIQHPTYEGLHNLFEETGNQVEQYAIYLFALDCGIDISQDHYWLVNSYTGEEWDEYGPAEPQGFAGVDLPKINEADIRRAEAMKDRLALLHR